MKTARRGFLQSLLAAPLLPTIGGHGPGAQPLAVPALDPVADALLAAVKARYGAQLDAAELEAVRVEIKKSLEGSDRLKAAPPRERGGAGHDVLRPSAGSPLVIGEDVFFASVRDLGAMLRARRFSAVELAEGYLQRLETIGPKLGAVVTVTRELALAQAHRANQELLAGKDRGPLHGIPYGAKDLLATKGIPTTWGAEPYRKQVFDYDAAVVERLQEAGAVLLGKLAMVELAGGMGYNNPDASFTGPGRTPWNPDYWSGGSSSGSGAATAAGLVAFAIGSETSGSILTPATFCGAERAAAHLRPRPPPRGDGPLLDARQARPHVPQRRRLRPRARRDRGPRPARPHEEGEFRYRERGALAVVAAKRTFRLGVVKDATAWAPSPTWSRASGAPSTSCAAFADRRRGRALPRLPLGSRGGDRSWTRKALPPSAS